MSNDEKIIEMKGKNPSLIKRLLLLFLVIAIVLVALAFVLFPDAMNLDGLRRWVKYQNLDPESGSLFTFDTHTSNRYVNFDDGLAVASVGGLSTYQGNGHEAVVSQGQLSVPAIAASDDLVMAYDVGGTALLAVSNSGGELLRVTADKPILDADLSQNGSICYTSGAAGYKSVLTVYNDRQERIYRWLSSTTYMPLCAISPKGDRLAAIGLDQKNGAFSSTLNLFRTDAEVMEKSVDLGNSLIYDLLYFDDKTICAIGETGVQLLDPAGARIADYSYEGSYLKDFDAGGDGFLTLSLNMYRAGNRYTLVTMDEDGNEIARLYLGQEILDLSASGKYIAVLTPNGLTVYNRNLQVYAETMETGSATAILMRDDGSVLLLGNGAGELFIP